MFRQLIRRDGDGGFVTEPVDWAAFAPPGSGDGALDAVHADLAATVQTRLEEVLLELAALAARADRRAGADDGRRRRAQLRGQLAVC